MSRENIELLFDKWNRAILSGNPKNVTALYGTTAVLLPTVSNEVRRKHEDIEAYFVNFLEKKPKSEINETNIRTFGEVAINSGVYTFSFNDGSAIKARFTFVYHWDGKNWTIVEHHSSQMPE